VAVKIKLKRLGKIRAPYYRIVVADARTKRDGRAIEEIGKYHPKAEPSFIEVNSERAQHWLSVGAQPTDPVRRLLEITGDWQKFKGLPGAEGTLRTAAAKEDRKEIFAAAVKETLGDAVTAPKGRARPKADAKPAGAAKADAKAGGGKADAKASDAKASDAKAGDAKAGDAKADAKAGVAKADAKPAGDAKADAKAADGKAADGKAGDAKADAKAADAKAGAGAAGKAEKPDTAASPDKAARPDNAAAASGEGSAKPAKAAKPAQAETADITPSSGD
jgi:small subunit ribosomal protein S16